MNTNAQDDPEAFYRTYILEGQLGMRNPVAVNQRVTSIFVELARYSHHLFPVYPAEQFNAGQATPLGIYLDVSIASNPNVEVTRFFLAHEWGHMMHGEELTSSPQVLNALISRP